MGLGRDYNECSYLELQRCGWGTYCVFGLVIFGGYCFGFEFHLFLARVACFGFGVSFNKFVWSWNMGI